MASGEKPNICCYKFTEFKLRWYLKVKSRRTYYVIQNAKDFQVDRRILFVYVWCTWKRRSFFNRTILGSEVTRIMFGARDIYTRWRQQNCDRIYTRNYSVLTKVIEVIFEWNMLVLRRYATTTAHFTIDVAVVAAAVSACDVVAYLSYGTCLLFHKWLSVRARLKHACTHDSVFFCVSINLKHCTINIFDAVFVVTFGSIPENWFLNSLNLAFRSLSYSINIFKTFNRLVKRHELICWEGNP